MDDVPVIVVWKCSFCSQGHLSVALNNKSWLKWVSKQYAWYLCLGKVTNQDKVNSWRQTVSGLASLAEFDVKIRVLAGSRAGSYQHHSDLIISHLDVSGRQTVCDESAAGGAVGGHLRGVSRRFWWMTHRIMSESCLSLKEKPTRWTVKFFPSTASLLSSEMEKSVVSFSYIREFHRTNVWLIHLFTQLSGQYFNFWEKLFLLLVFERSWFKTKHTKNSERGKRYLGHRNRNKLFILINYSILYYLILKISRKSKNVKFKKIK